MPSIESRIMIQASAERVWQCLTEPALMKRWMGEDDMRLDIQTTWQPGTPILIKGVHLVEFEIMGKVLEYTPHTRLAYTHLSSVSNLADIPHHHTILRFTLVPGTEGTALTVQLENFPTDSIYRHLHLYWKVTPQCIKALAENTILRA